MKMKKSKVKNQNEIKKILIIDDDFFIRTLVKDIFWVHGRGKYNVYETNNTQEGEKILKEENPNLIFLDLMLGEGPKESLDFIKKLKSDPKTKNVKLIVFSGYPDLKDKALELGADKFLTKGEQLPKELFDSVEKLLSNQQ